MSNQTHEITNFDRIYAIVVNGFLRDINLLKKTLSANIDLPRILTMFKEGERLKQNILKSFVSSAICGFEDSNESKQWSKSIANAEILKCCGQANQLINKIIMNQASGGTSGSIFAHNPAADSESVSKNHYTETNERGLKSRLEYSNTEDIADDISTSFRLTKIDSCSAIPISANLQDRCMKKASNASGAVAKNPKLQASGLGVSKLAGCEIELLRKEKTPKKPVNRGAVRSAEKSVSPLQKKPSRQSIVMKSVESEAEMKMEAINAKDLSKIFVDQGPNDGHAHASETLHNHRDRRAAAKLAITKHINDLQVKGISPLELPQGALTSGRKRRREHSRNQSRSRSRNPAPPSLPMPKDPSAPNSARNSRLMNLQPANTQDKTSGMNTERSRQTNNGVHPIHNTYATQMTKDTYLSSQLDGEGCGFFGYQRVGQGGENNFYNFQIAEPDTGNFELDEQEEALEEDEEDDCEEMECPIPAGLGKDFNKRTPGSSKQASRQASRHCSQIHDDAGGYGHKLKNSKVHPGGYPMSSLNSGRVPSIRGNYGNDLQKVGTTTPTQRIPVQTCQQPPQSQLQSQQQQAAHNQRGQQVELLKTCENLEAQSPASSSEEEDEMRENNFDQVKSLKRAQAFSQRTQEASRVTTNHNSKTVSFQVEPVSIKAAGVRSSDKTRSFNQSEKLRKEICEPVGSKLSSIKQNHQNSDRVTPSNTLLDFTGISDRMILNNNHLHIQQHGGTTDRSEKEIIKMFHQNSLDKKHERQEASINRDSRSNSRPFKKSHNPASKRYQLNPKRPRKQSQKFDMDLEEKQRQMQSASAAQNSMTSGSSSKNHHNKKVRSSFNTRRGTENQLRHDSRGCSKDSEGTSNASNNNDIFSSKNQYYLQQTQNTNEAIQEELEIEPSPCVSQRQSDRSESRHQNHSNTTTESRRERTANTNVNNSSSTRDHRKGSRANESVATAVKIKGNTPTKFQKSGLFNRSRSRVSEQNIEAAVLESCSNRLIDNRGANVNQFSINNYMDRFPTPKKSEIVKIPNLRNQEGGNTRTRSITPTKQLKRPPTYKSPPHPLEEPKALVTGIVKDCSSKEILKSILLVCTDNVATYNSDFVCYTPRMFKEDLKLYNGIEKNRDHSIALKSKTEGCLVNFKGTVLEFKLNPKNNKLSFPTRIQFVSKEQELSSNQIGFRDVIYYEPLQSYILLDVKGPSFKFWMLKKNAKNITFLRSAKSCQLSCPKFFSKSKDGRILYLNYSELGIHIISPKSKRFSTFEPHKVIPTPEGHCYIDVCPLENNSVVIATDLGAICYYNSKLEGLASYQLKLKGTKHSKELVSAVALCPQDKNFVVSTYVMINGVRTRFKLYWLKLPDLRASARTQQGSPIVRMKKPKFKNIACYSFTTGVNITQNHGIFGTSDATTHSSVQSLKFCEVGPVEMPIFYCGTESDLFTSFCLQDGNIQRFKTESIHCSRNYKLEACDDEIWGSDSDGNICRLTLLPGDGGGLHAIAM